MPAGVCQRAVLMQGHGWIGREVETQGEGGGPNGAEVPVGPKNY